MKNKCGYRKLHFDLLIDSQVILSPFLHLVYCAIDCQVLTWQLSHTVIAHSVIYIADHQRKSSLNRFQLPFPRKVKGDAEVQSVYTLQDDLLK